MNILDCKDKLYMNLINNNYYNLTPNQKKILVNEELKKYLLNKINNNVYKNDDISDLVKYLSKKTSIVPLILFIISIMDEIQHYKITWKIYTDVINTKIISDNNIVLRINSNEKYDEVFNYLYDYYLNEFDKEYNKTLKKQD